MKDIGMAQVHCKKTMRVPENLLRHFQINIKELDYGGVFLKFAENNGKIIVECVKMGVSND